MPNCTHTTIFPKGSNHRAIVKMLFILLRRRLVKIADQNLFFTPINFILLATELKSPLDPKKHLPSVEKTLHPFHSDTNSDFLNTPHLKGPR